MRCRAARAATRAQKTCACFVELTIGWKPNASLGDDTWLPRLRALRASGVRAGRRCQAKETRFDALSASRGRANRREPRTAAQHEDGLARQGLVSAPLAPPTPSFAQAAACPPATLSAAQQIARWPPTPSFAQAAACPPATSSAAQQIACCANCRHASHVSAMSRIHGRPPSADSERVGRTGWLGSRSWRSAAQRCIRWRNTRHGNRWELIRASAASAPITAEHLPRRSGVPR
jgi:hypothetical protein